VFREWQGLQMWHHQAVPAVHPIPHPIPKMRGIFTVYRSSSSLIMPPHPSGCLPTLPKSRPQHPSIIPLQPIVSCTWVCMSRVAADIGAWGLGVGGGAQGRGQILASDGGSWRPAADLDGAGRRRSSEAWAGGKA
jgi:hypothetical protein